MESLTFTEADNSWGTTKTQVRLQSQRYLQLRTKKSIRWTALAGDFSSVAVLGERIHCAVVKPNPAGMLQGTVRIQDRIAAVVYLDTMIVTGQGLWISVASSESMAQQSRVEGRIEKPNLEEYLARLIDHSKYIDSLAHRRKAIDESLQYFNAALNADFLLCDEALKRIKVDQIASSVMVSILGITLPAKHRLEQRRTFFDRVFAAVTRLKGKRYAKSLLSKYE